MLDAAWRVVTFVVTHAPGDRSEETKTAWLSEADARTRTGDPFVTSVGRVSPQAARSRAKPHRSKESSPPKWRPKTWNSRDVDPA